MQTDGYKSHHNINFYRKSAIMFAEVILCFESDSPAISTGCMKAAS